MSLNFGTSKRFEKLVAYLTASSAGKNILRDIGEYLNNDAVFNIQELKNRTILGLETNMCLNLKKFEAAHVIIFVRKTNEILMGYHKQKKWDIQGGKREKEETIVKTILGEVYEEIGCIIDPRKLILLREKMTTNLKLFYMVDKTIKVDKWKPRDSFTCFSWKTINNMNNWKGDLDWSATRLHPNMHEIVSEVLLKISRSENSWELAQKNADFMMHSRNVIAEGERIFFEIPQAIPESFKKYLLNENTPGLTKRKDEKRRLGEHRRSKDLAETTIDRIVVKEEVDEREIERFSAWEESEEEYEDAEETIISIKDLENETKKRDRSRSITPEFIDDLFEEAESSKSRTRAKKVAKNVRSLFRVNSLTKEEIAEVIDDLLSEY